MINANLIPSMKTLKSFLALGLVVLSLVAGVRRTAAIDCLARPFLNVSDKLVEQQQRLIEVLTLRVKQMKEGIEASPRWFNSVDKVATADAEWKRSLSLAEQKANSAGKAVGSQATVAQIEILQDSRVLNSTRSSLDEVGQGVGTMVART